MSNDNTGEPTPGVQSRRDFLRNAAIGGGSVAVAAALPATALGKTEDAKPERPEEGYRLTRHIADYYKSSL